MAEHKPSENKLFLELISPDKTLISETVDEIYAPGEEGDLGILPNHIQFICALRAGEFRYMKGSMVDYVAVDGGFLEVMDNKVTILADGAELGKDVDLEEVIRRKAQAEKELEEARKKDMATFTAAEAKLFKEIIRINAANHYK